MTLMAGVADILSAPTDPTVEAEKPVESTFGWATVTSALPFRIRKDGETDELPMTPEVIGAGGFTVANRVWCQFFGLRVLILGGGGTAGQDVWHPAPYATGWSDFGSGYEFGSYTLTSGMVQLAGECKGGSGTIFTLPTGYRPGATHQFIAAASAGIADIRVFTTGTVTLAGFLSGGTSASISLSQIRFPPTP